MNQVKTPLPLLLLQKFIVYFVLPVVIFWVGFGHVGPLMRGEFTQHLGSIEVSYIQMARFIEKSLPNFAWQPKWYLGYPMPVIYTPVVPVTEFILGRLLSWSYAHAYRVLTATAYILGLVTLYLFARTLFKNTVSGMLAALCYGIVPSVMVLLYSEVANDRFLASIVEPRRFTILVRWGEGPHIVSLVFLPLAGLFFVKFLRQGRKLDLLGGVIFTALTLLTNSIGAWALAILCFSLSVGEMIESSSGWQTVVKRAFLFGAGALGVSCFWFNPLFLSTFFREGGGALSYWRDQFPWGWVMLGTGLAIYMFIATKLLRRFSGAAATVLFFLIMFGLVNTYYASGNTQLELVPQVLRLTTEVDMAAAFLVGLIVAMVGTLLMRKNQGVFIFGMITLLAIAGFPLSIRQQELARELPQFSKPAAEKGIVLKNTAEYEVALTLEGLVKGQERVLVPGNYGFYLNYFTDVPQLRGALYQSAVNPWPEHIYYQVTNGADGDISLDWLKIANIGWLLYSGPREIYHDYRVPAQKFDQSLEFIEEKSGDRYYKVPLVDASLAKVVPSGLARLQAPKNAVDTPAITDYVRLLESQPQQLELKETNNGVYAISGTVNEKNLILVQMAYAPGWQAKDARRKSLEVRRDPLGFILIRPQEMGRQEIVLAYRRPWQIYFGWLVFIATLLAGIFILVKQNQPLFTTKPDSSLPET